jgi:hypothetical protein
MLTRSIASNDTFMINYTVLLIHDSIVSNSIVSAIHHTMSLANDLWFTQANTSHSSTMSAICWINDQHLDTDDIMVSK